MRNKRAVNGVTVNAVAGTHTVFLGLDLSESARSNCLGFAIAREDHTESERYWMYGTKTFEATDPGRGPGGQVSSRQHPFQTFQWCDYSAKPDHSYTYTVVPLYGTPEALKEEHGRVDLRISTEKESAGIHSVFFNRGAIASQEYARRFENKSPSELEGAEKVAAYRWLSRGLLEAFQGFVGRANGSSFGLYGAVYEFQLPEALSSLKAAAATGADVKIIYDAIASGGGPKERNEAAIAEMRISRLCIPRRTGKIMHNKFFILTRNRVPIAVWTGSTNLTENGVYGHLNCGQVVEDPQIAAAYFDYWNELRENPQLADEREWVQEHNPCPSRPWDQDTAPVFSPHHGLDVLERYAELAGEANRALFMTFAFGMHKSFLRIYGQEDSILRMALMEKEGSGAGLAQAKIDIRRIRALPNVIIAVGNNIALNSFDHWLAERRQLSAEANVRYIHTKFMLVDPLGNVPTVVTGSANFSAASTDTNNENMLVIRADKRVADIYFGEFMRLYSHYAFREAVAISKAAGETHWNPSHLLPDGSWQSDYFRSGTGRCLRRVYFAGS